ncbi:MAG: hypothetical protein KIT80_16640 [Chitinophagaceae bacterium]|nr:hypothetical protein [Chitinophagaceae bacterium]MCW5928547.1 hypothetical protein [Chitinophagaceae bacterium]
MNYRSYSDLAQLIRRNLGKFQSGNYDLIVGIPRSGMVPAYMIGMQLNTPVCSFIDLASNHFFKKIGVRKIKGNLEKPQDALKILIVEDSYVTGTKLWENIEQLPEEIQGRTDVVAIFSAVKSPRLSFYLEQISYPRIFEWNIFHHILVSSSAFDMDGVLCEDPLPEQNDDGNRYREFVLNATPKYLPTVPIKTIVTSRLEKYRDITEEWLKKHGVEYGELIMLDLPSAAERQRLGNHASFKAKEYKKIKYDLFFESEYNQAIEINRLTNKPVYCVDENILIDGRGIQQLRDKTWGLRNRIKKIPVVGTILTSILRRLKK